MNHDIEALCQAQLARYPELGVVDLVKAMYQCEFGCGHLISDPESARRWLAAEAESFVPNEGIELIESLQGDFCRLHLQGMQQAGLSVETVFRLFLLSAQEQAGSMARFQQDLTVLETMITDGRLPLPVDEARRFLAEYRQAGCPATHHSEQFRKAYHPAYRVIRSDFARYLPIFGRIDQLLMQERPIVVAIEGGSASGKSTLATLMQHVYGCVVFHMDDFFLQPHQRTPERFAEPGGNVDYERFHTEVLTPLRQGLPVTYRAFDCSMMSLGKATTVVPERLTIVEGVYSMHPALAEAYDLSVFLHIGSDAQAARILRRNGAALQTRFLNEWIPLEKRYFDTLHIPESCSLCIEC